MGVCSNRTLCSVTTFRDVFLVFVVLMLLIDLTLIGRSQYNVSVMQTVNTSLIELSLRSQTGAPFQHVRKAKPEVRHIAFLKIHKAASSTVLNILYRFSEQRDLNVLLPFDSNYINFERRNFVRLPKGQSYDVLCNHVIFNERMFSNYLPNDTVYLAIVRRPLERLHSAFWYYLYEYPMAYLTYIFMKYPTQTFKSYVANAASLEPLRPSESQTNNRMAVDFGFEENKFSNVSAFHDYIRHMDKKLDLVLVADLFDESLILMKRLLNWSFKDIIYIQKNKHINKPKLRKTKEIDLQTKDLLKLDSFLYEHYLKIFQERTNREGNMFQLEVKYFKELNKISTDFCLGESNVGVLHFTESSYSGSFNITRNDCLLMLKDEIPFLSVLRGRAMQKYLQDTPWYFYGFLDEFYV